MTAIKFLGEVPDLDTDTEIVLEDEVRKGDLITFEARGGKTVAIRRVGPDFRGEAYLVDPQSTHEELILVRMKAGSGPQREWDLERVLRETFSNAAFFYRDTDLHSEGLLAKYHPGMILKEHGFVDCTYLSGGLAARHRYLIITAEAKDLHALAGVDQKYGPAIINRDSFFKVLDVQHAHEHAQIVLLHLPEELLEAMDRGAELTDLEKEMVNAARKDFEEALRTTPAPALTEPEWLERVAFPIGMSEQGELFYERPSVEDRG